MFESILEKVLLSYFGKFISGFDKQNIHVGIFKGDLIIENVAIKPEILDLFDFPMKILFSKVGKLQMKIPLTKLSNSPVEVILERVLIIVAPKNRSEWTFNDANTIAKKFELIQEYAKTCIDKFLKKQ